jgi:hypothetical protein
MSAVEAVLWAISIVLDALAYVIDGITAKFFPQGGGSIDWPDVRQRLRRQHRANSKHPSLRF